MPPSPRPPSITKGQLLEAMMKGRRFDGVEFFKHWKTRNSANWLIPFAPPIQRDSATTAQEDDELGASWALEFKSSSLVAFKIAAEQSPENWPKLKRSVLADALAEAATQLATAPKRGITSLDVLNMRRGLQLYRVEIVQDDDADERPLDLSNGDFPFSLRLICCVIRAPLALSNLNLVTLDLSGTALVGVDGSFLRARGSVRLRNSYSSGPMDFTGADIHGYFDASSALIHPFGPLPAGQAVSGDRGMLNLSQAHVSNEVRLGRATILGGLSMRGLKAERSIYLQNARLLSPLAVLERLLAKASFDDQTDERELMLFSASEGFIDFLAPSEFTEASIRSTNQQKNRACLDVLMKESLRVRTSALRADGIKVAGSIFAQNLIGWGRLRLKYAEVVGSLSLQGADLKSAEALLIPFEHHVSSHGLFWQEDNSAQKICFYRAKTFDVLTNGAQDTLAPGADDYALDLRESEFGGIVRIGALNGDTAPRSPASQTKIDGVIALDRATLDSDLIFDGSSFQWSCRIKSSHKNFAPGENFYKYVFEAAKKQRDDERNHQVERGQRYSVEAKGLYVGGDFSLLECNGLNGIDLSDAEIGGDFALFDKMKRKDILNPRRIDHNKLDLETTHAASELSGRLQLSAAKIGGDCKLLFDRNLGPHVKAERVEVGGALTIGHNPTANGKTVESYSKLIATIHNETADLQHVASLGGDVWGQFRFAKPPINFGGETQYQIDLGNARATFLHHPWSAWPATGHLIIAGFHYDRSLEFGPLAPNIFEEDLRWAFWGQYLRSWLGTFVLCCFAIIFAGLALGKVERDNQLLGSFESVTLATFFISTSFYRLVRQLTDPNTLNSHPIALEWLRLQTVDRNVYRSQLTFWRCIFIPVIKLNELIVWTIAFVSERGQSGATQKPLIFDRPNWPKRAFQSTLSAGHIYHSLEPYSVAVKALRESGRWISANLVEQARLKVRDAQLSWRSHFIQKSLSALIQLLNNYGFNLSRPLFWVGFLACFSTILSYQAAVVGAITPKVMQVDTGVRPPPALKAPEKVACNQACFPVPEGLNTLVFAIDQVVPLVDLGQNSNWEVSKTIAPLWGPPWLTFEILFFAIRIIGFAMVGLLILAFSSRISLVHQRYSD